MSGQHYCLRWNNYQSNMTSVFHQLLENEAFVDVTLACNDLSLKAHKVVLSACSSYFQKLLLENPCKHPTIIMPQDVSYADLRFIIEFVYKGEIGVSQTELQSLLRTAEQLKIKGLCEPSETNENENEVLRPADTRNQDSNSNNNGEVGSNDDAVDDDHVILPVESTKGYTKVRSNNNDTSINYQRATTKRTKRRRRSRNGETEEDDLEEVKTTVVVEEDDRKKSIADDIEENVMPESLNEHKRKRLEPEQIRPLNMTSHGIVTGQPTFTQFGVDTDDFPPEPPAPSAIPVGHVEMHEHSPTRTLLTNTIHRTDLSESNGCKKDNCSNDNSSTKFETLRSYERNRLIDMETHHNSISDDEHSIHTMMVTPELMGMMPGVSTHRLGLGCNNGDTSGMKCNGHGDGMQHGTRGHSGGGPKTWTQEDMDMALDALRNHNMSLTKASATYGIPSTTLWQRAHRLGIDTPKKEGPTKSWTEENLNNALEALRTGTISANKASKAYGIPSSTLYKIARREGIRLAAPFNAAPTTWTPEDLEKALDSIRSGQTSVQKASTEFGIPTGTLYGRCKREGIELSRSNPTPWSEDAMGEALEAVRLGHMSINQAAIHYNLPYSSLYGRFKRGIKYETDGIDPNSDSQSQIDSHHFNMDYSSNHQPIQYQNQTNS